MYLALKDYRWPEALTRKQEELLGQGIRTGATTVAGRRVRRHVRRVGSEYWRSVLRSELAAWEENRPNDNPEFWPDGVTPGPRTLLTATVDGHIVGLYGPRGQAEKRPGLVYGICTDPLYSGRGSPRCSSTC
jgi:hypothetical protein